MPDIDIDFPDRNLILEKIKHVCASRKTKEGNFVQHNTGVYFQDIPRNMLNNLSSIEYKEAEERGYFKIDFLNVNLYKDIKSEEHLIQLMNQEPIWELLEDEEFVNMLFHLNGHTNLLKKLKPKNIDQLAAILALIRPAKKHLIGRSWFEIMNEVWVRPDTEEYFFKKSHAYAYATAIVVQMNLICEMLSNNSF